MYASTVTGELRVLVVADDPLARAGLAALLADQPDCVVVDQVAGYANMSEELEVYQPDVILWDLGWNTERSLEQLSDARDLNLPIVAMMADRSAAFGVWSSGVRGLLPREANAATLLATMRAAREGLMVLTPELSESVFQRRDQEPAPLIENMTPREMEVLRLLAEGLPNKSIAHSLGISEHTVKFHLNAVMGKLGVQSRTEAVIAATRLGLILL